jgi:PE family
MSFATTAPEMVTAAAGNLASIGSALGDAAAAAAGPTTSVAAAAADDVSLAVSQLLGTYGQQFQALSAQAAAFHGDFVSLLNGGAAAYLSTEIANAEQSLGNAAAATNPISTLLSGLSAAGATAAQAGGPWQTLFNNTGANLNAIGSTWAADPFPVLKQVIINQNGYAQEFWGGVAVELQNFPTPLANVPANIQLAIQGASTFNPAALAQAYINQQIGYTQTIVTSLQNTGAGLQKTFPVFEYDMGLVGNAISTGDYQGAEQDAVRAILNLLISGYDTSNLSLSDYNIALTSLSPLQTQQQGQIGGPIGIEGPLGDLFPILGIPALQAQNFANLLPQGSIPWQIAHNFTSGVSTLTNTNLSAHFSVSLNTEGGGLFNPLTVTSSSLGGDAFFGLPLVLGVAALGPPFATLGGLFTGAGVLGHAVATGNGVAAVGALVDMPAYALNGFLNGTVQVDLPMSVGETITKTVPGLGSFSGTFTIPAVIHVPFNGILVPPQPVTATLPLSLSTSSNDPHLVTNYNTQYNLTFGGTEFGGAVYELLNDLPQQVALAISPR